MRYCFVHVIFSVRFRLVGADSIYIIRSIYPYSYVSVMFACTAASASLDPNCSDPVRTMQIHADDNLRPIQRVAAKPVI